MMIKTKKILVFMLSLIILLGTINVTSIESQAATPSVTVSYAVHIQNLGDSQGYVKNGVMAGTIGQSKRLESIRIKVSGNSNLGIRYSTHCQGYGWRAWSSNGVMNGTQGESKRLEAIKIELTGADKDKYDVYYRVHAQSYGWLAWAKNGAISGTAGMSKRLEAIQIVIKAKGSSAPGKSYAGVNATNANSKAYIKPSQSITYRSHVQGIGWQNYVSNGAVSGTTGQSKRIEAINISLQNQNYTGGITYRAHVQGIGWQSWKSNGAMAGTSGQGKRIEALQIKLTGTMAEKYDVYYRVSVQNIGWLDWAKNGATAGTLKMSRRVEALQIVLVNKGGAKPGKISGIESARTKSMYEAIYEDEARKTTELIDRYGYYDNRPVVWVTAEKKNIQLVENHVSYLIFNVYFKNAHDCGYYYEIPCSISRFIQIDPNLKAGQRVRVCVNEYTGEYREFIAQGNRKVWDIKDQCIRGVTSNGYISMESDYPLRCYMENGVLRVKYNTTCACLFNYPKGDVEYFIRKKEDTYTKYDQIAFDYSGYVTFLLDTHK